MHKDENFALLKNGLITRVITWINFVDLESPMIYTKIQPQNFLGSGEEAF